VGQNHHSGGFSMSRKKTAAEKFAQGDTRQRGAKKLAARIAQEPKTQRGLECPAQLRGDAAGLFRFFAEQLEVSRLDAKPDSQALAIASEALATSWKAARRLQREGEVKTIPILAGVGRSRRVVGHRQVRNRWFAVKVESQKMFDRIAGKFGLVGPVSRAGLEVAPSSGQGNKKLWDLLTAPREPKIKPPEQIAWEAQQAREAEEAKPKEPVQ
jgi:hypothetical protein